MPEWAADHPAAADLESLGRVAWADSELLRALRPVGDEHLARRQLHGYTSTRYLATLAATLRAYSLHPQDVPVVERLRLLLLFRALEAAAHGNPSEAKLAVVCKTVRLVSDDAGHDDWRLIRQIAHLTSGFVDFSSETHFQVQKAREAAAPGSAERNFHLRLEAILDRQFKALQGASP